MNLTGETKQIYATNINAMFQESIFPTAHNKY